jgi:hypothetical protein
MSDEYAIRRSIDWALDALRSDPDLPITVMTLGGGGSRCSWIEIEDVADGPVGIRLHVDDDALTVIRMPLAHVVGRGGRPAALGHAAADARVPPTRRARAMRAIAIGAWSGRGDGPTYSDLAELLDEVDASGGSLTRSDRPLASVSEANAGLADKVLLHLARRAGPSPSHPITPAALKWMLASMGGGWLDAPIAQRVSDLHETGPDATIDVRSPENLDLLALWRLGRLFTAATMTYHPFIAHGDWVDALHGEQAL